MLTSLMRNGVWICLWVAFSWGQKVPFRKRAPYRARCSVQTAALFVLASSGSLQLQMFALFAPKSILFGLWNVYRVDCCEMCCNCDGCPVCSIWDQQAVRSLLVPFGNFKRQGWSRCYWLITVLMTSDNRLTIYIHTAVLYISFFF